MGKRDLSTILVVDIEATCWETAPPEGQEGEIIEIGLCTLDVQSGQRRDKTSILVKPARSTVSPFCTELTTLTQEDVDRGIPFAEACRQLQDVFHSKSRTWASYGDYDRTKFQQQCADWSVPYPFGKTHINVKNLFAIAAGLSREQGMAGALQKLKIPLEGTHHRGHDDAWNIAAILWHVIRAGRGCLPG